MFFGPKPTGAWFKHHFGDKKNPSDIVRNPLLYSTYQRWPEIVQDVRVWHLRELFLAMQRVCAIYLNLLHVSGMSTKKQYYSMFNEFRISAFFKTEVVLDLIINVINHLFQEHL